MSIIKVDDLLYQCHDVKSLRFNNFCITNTVYLIFYALNEESSQTNVILEYKLLASILSAVCSVIQ